MSRNHILLGFPRLLDLPWRSACVPPNPSVWLQKSQSEKARCSSFASLRPWHAYEPPGSNSKYFHILREGWPSGHGAAAVALTYPGRTIWQGCQPVLPSFTECERGRDADS